MTSISACVDEVSASAAALPAVQTPSPGHLVPLADGWSLWRRFCLRGAGFPVARVLDLASPDATRAADGWLAGAVSLDAFHATYEREAARASATLRRVAADRRFREAIAWQSPGVLRTALDPLLRRASEKHNADTRRKERAVALYLQRYCTKNESIGFFGPFAFGTFREGGPVLRCRYGPRPLDKRTVYFEYWAIDAIAGALARRADVRPWLAPRRSAAVRLEPGGLVFYGTRQRPVPARDRLLALCDGARPARDIAQTLVAERVFPDEPAAFAGLESLERARMVHWTIDVPTAGQPFETALRSRLERLGDPAVRAGCTSVLDELEAKRDEVSRAAGDAVRLETALAELDAVFTHHAQRAPERNAGKTYGARRVIYEDCRRGVDLHLNAALLARLGPPLALVLQSLRWYSHVVAARYADQLRALFRQLAGPSRRVELATMWPLCAAMFPRAGGRPPRAVQDVLADYQARWAEALALGEPTARRIERSVREIAPAVRRLFAAPGPGMTTARCHSPDILIAARGADALDRGECTFILGEIHAFMNTFEQEAMVCEHPDRAELLAALAADFDRGRLAAAVPRAMAGRCRPTPYSRHEADVLIEHDDAASWRPAAQTLRLADLAVVEDRGRLQIVTHDGRRRWDLVAAFDSTLLLEPAVPLLAGRDRTPRITVDDLVITRESFHLDRKALGFCSLRQPAARFAEARRLVRDFEVPRFAFCRASSQVKPVFVDFASPALVDVLAHVAHDADHVTVTEMLPGPDECWLVDADGQTVTSEVRVVAIDPTRCPATL